MFNQSPWRRSLGISAAATLLGSLALAGQTTVQDSIPLQTTNWQEDLTIPQFDPALGTLDSVSIRFETNIEGSIGVENTSPNSQLLSATLQATIRLFAPDQVTELLTSSPSNQIPDIALAPFDGTVDFAGPSGFTSPQLTDAEVGNLSVPPRGTLTLAQFIGNGTVTFPAAAQGSSFFTGNTGNEASLFELRAAARLIVTYNFTGEPQKCEPNLKEIPGSLLLFPRFDNRTNTITAITVTNTNCDFTPGPGPLLNGTVDVEYVYIGRYGPNGQELDCLETNRTRRLTPCDTITLLTRFDNPNVERGFLYVFAKDPQTGQAIVWNHLIGQALYIGSNDIDGDPSEDALNARTFLGIGAERTPTDHDGDGIRDLDGVEYSEAPDEILIPRFLGQDGNDQNGPNGFHSRLVLVGLSGGSQFTTQVLILFYNDNEQTFSTQWSFRCWDDPRLTEIDDGFLETFLDSTDNAPNEIIGATDKESGWIRIDGQIAFSSADAISEPAIYAVLFERFGAYVVCDLPWELCTQTNGDLWPNGVIAED
jgi:hypothetical protein